MTTAFSACRHLITIPGVGQLTALAFVAAVDDPKRFKRSRDFSAYFDFLPSRYQSGEAFTPAETPNATLARRARTLLYEVANVLLTRCKVPMKLMD